MSESSFVPKPPYVPFGTFKAFIESFRDNGLPDVIDRSLMQKLSGTVQSMLASALRSMGFIDASNAPTDRFRKYISGQVVEQKEAIAEGVKDCYSAVFAHSTPPQKMTQGQFDKALRDEYAFVASTLDKAASFFLAACAEAGIEVSPHLSKRSATAKRKRRERTEKADKPEASPAAANVDDRATHQSPPKLVEAAKPLPYQLLDLLKERDFADEHKQAVWQLVQYLMEREKKNEEHGQLLV
jgi:hypothetical protein